MIHIENISYKYSAKKEVFSNFSLSLPPGKIYGLLGKNGEGKTTLLHLIAGLLATQKGMVSLYGYDCSLRKPEMLSKLFLIPEEFYLPPISLEAYIKIYAPFYEKFSREDLAHFLQIFGLDMNVHLSALSMGEKKKVYMSLALAANTPYLIMDEPSNGLDIPSKEQFRKVIREGMNAERTIIISTHQVKDVETLLDHIIMINQGKIVLNTSVHDVMQRIQFTEVPAHEEITDAVYSQPSPTGKYIIRPRTGNTPGYVNIEMLFNAMLTTPDAVNRLLQTPLSTNA
ncbi:MAG: ABC transporter ATP-binding protein [Phocaeicola sp.]|nr:ABC transporter ATP-binding protein [Phocaeicola sp.]MDD7448493.1 ABC transporter ATP-binding protein [Prevotellaceae bacterium]MDY3914734.1 ABC transporter ATP-binding protein [Phocaeicola sp.]MDY5939834.1 ABC transporter ATP-binding protein [Phocaeicola sp.]